ncbi:hypothetical protein [Bradyrhizobium sp. STM 3562]|uniref:hypothetical protein n=1 Tax=Bradyrhizobium sp. STM 3562 TaxID=578924 RepID=UPI00388F5EF7
MAITIANLFSAALTLPFVASQALHLRSRGSVENVRSSSGERADVVFLSDGHAEGVSRRQGPPASARCIIQVIDAPSIQSQAGAGRHEGAKAEKAVPSPTAGDWVGRYQDGSTHERAVLEP